MFTLNKNWYRHFHCFFGTEFVCKNAKKSHILCQEKFCFLTSAGKQHITWNCIQAELLRRSLALPSSSDILEHNYTDDGTNIAYLSNIMFCTWDNDVNYLIVKMSRFKHHYNGCHHVTSAHTPPFSPECLPENVVQSIKNGNSWYSLTHYHQSIKKQGSQKHT